MSQCQAVGVARLLAEITGGEGNKTVLRVDNKFTISLIKNPMHHNQSKDIDIRFHLIQDYAHGGNIEVRFIRTNEQLGPRGHCIEASLQGQISGALQQDWHLSSSLMLMHKS